jgi:hypothetical protein
VHRMKSQQVVLLFALAVSGQFSLGQQAPAKQPISDATGTSTIAPTSLPASGPAGTASQAKGNTRPAPATSSVAALVHLGQPFRVPLSKGVTCSDYQTAGVEPRDISFEIEGIDTGLRALGCSQDMNSGNEWLQFKLKHMDPPPAGIDATAYQTAWEAVVGQSISDWGAHDVRFRIIAKNAASPASAPPALQGRMSVAVWQGGWRVYLGSAMVIVVWGLTYVLSSKTALIRDPLNEGTALQSRTFSLARTQLAWWFAIIFASFVFLWLSTGDIPALSTQALALLGISSVTTLAATAVRPVEVLPGGRANVFFQELISDATGPTIQRFQMLVMTIALGVMFLINVFTRLSMPVFDGSLITLMGLSAGTYVGAKIPEITGGKAVADSSAQN